MAGSSPPRSPWPRYAPPLLLLVAIVLAGLVFFALPAAESTDSSSSGDSAPERTATSAEHTVHRLSLAGPLARANAEVSGLAWHGDDLILLPQHPYRMSGRTDVGTLYALSKDQIEAHLSGRRDSPLRPRPITFVAPALREYSSVYEGCEAIAFAGDRAFVVTEAVADAETGAMHGYLFSGRLRGDTLRLAPRRRRATLPSQTEAHNMAYEALVATPDRVAALYEANGRNLNPRPQAMVFSPTLQAMGRLPFPSLEYRLTDATAPDAEGRFWVTNYFFPGERDRLRPAPDPLARAASANGGPEPSSEEALPDEQTDERSTVRPVERLVEYQMEADGFRRTATSPLYLSLLPNAARNWEGLARFRSDARGPGFLIVTDQYPETVLAFVGTEDHAP